MKQLSYRRHRFPPLIIQHATWLYLRFTLSYRDVEELLAERGIEVSNETIRRWVLKFGRLYAKRLRRCRSKPDDRWHLDEMFVTIRGKRMYLWRAVDCPFYLFHPPQRTRFLARAGRTRTHSSYRLTLVGKPRISAVDRIYGRDR